MSAVTSVETGSSPLARGLRPERPLRRRPNRIIPARAGFTATWTPSARPSPDHPRSRGVYSPTTAFPGIVAGSSPLARGLLDRKKIYQTLSRIIPARAGFTTYPPSPASPTWDHPRSRGVYTVSGIPTHLNLGSSPLARGLRSGRESERGEGGIIPARAGFTWLIPPAPAVCTDHPRSRGVYPSCTNHTAPLGGSSPLARGLRIHSHTVRRESRIIPARAGFTGTCLTRPTTR